MPAHEGVISDCHSSLNIPAVEKSLLKRKILKLNEKNEIFIDRRYLQNKDYVSLFKRMSGSRDIMLIL